MSVLNNNGDLGNVNHTLLALVPKVHNPMLVFDFRPISLCNVLNKLIAKCVVNHFIILEEHSAFVPGRQILDNVMVAFETMHCLNTCRTGSKHLLALKLDMSDRVEWIFVETMMVRMGFAWQWINLIMKLISSVSFSILISARTFCAHKEFTPG